MKVVSTREFRAPVESVWAILREPGNMPAWNPKCRSCTNVRGGREGSRFEAVFEMSGKTRRSDGEILCFHPPREIEFRFHDREPGREGHVDERFLLSEPSPGRTRLKHVVNFRHAPLPFFVKCLIVILGRFGRRVGDDPLAGIDDLLPGTPPTAH